MAFLKSPVLLNSKNLIQATEDEKLVVATLATLDSGTASSLIKQDLKYIIQSRRKAEGKDEIEVEFKKPVRDELTSEEVVKRQRRRELNRLAARRSREKGQKRKDKLVEEIKMLQSQNSKLANDLTFLTDQRDNIITTLRQHMTQCSDVAATRTAAEGLPRRVRDMLEFLFEPPPTSLSSKLSLEETPSSLAPAHLHIYISPSTTTSLTTTSKESDSTTTATNTTTPTPSQNLTYSSCPPSPVILGLTGTPLFGGQGGSSPSSTSVTSNPFHFSPSKMSSLPSQTATDSSTSLEDFSRSSQDSTATPPFSPPLMESPKKTPSHSLNHYHHHKHYYHHSPRHEAGSSSSTSLSSSLSFSKIEHSMHHEDKEEFTRPASPSPVRVHPTRFLLERSFSCPSDSSIKEKFHHFHHHETSSSPLLSPQSVFNNSEEELSCRRDDSFSSGYSTLGSTSSSQRSSDDRRYLSEQEAPLDLVVRSSSSISSHRLTDSGDESSSSLFSMDTWPRRSSSKPGLIRGGRRWSVGDQHSAHLREPLNLSTKPETNHSVSSSQP